MRVALVNQYFYPDVSATAQIATDLAEDLVRAGIEVTVLAGRGSYLGGAPLARQDVHRGVKIERVAATSLGKMSLLRRGADYASFYAAATARLATMRGFDALVVMTTPPLIAAAGLMTKALSGSSLVYWVQDLYPDVAVAMGALRPRSPTTVAMRTMSRAVLRRAEAVVVLGDAMKDRVVLESANPLCVHVVPNWADGDAIQPVEHDRNPVRAKIAHGAKCIFMYSGNMGRAHDIETLLEGARLLEGRRDVRFVFVGDGAKRGLVDRASRSLRNVEVASYFPREQLSESLSAADVHLATLLPEFNGLIEPSKLYGIMAAGRPTLFVGPSESEVAKTIERERCGRVVSPGSARDFAACVEALVDDATGRVGMGLRAREALLARYTRRVATAKFAAILRALAPHVSPAASRAGAGLRYSK
jgi:colanic acid biosynthesis glycosyl transferase WcaI